MAERASPTVGVGAVVFDERDRLLMVERARGAHRGKWSVPGGKVRLGESLRSAVAREVQEETGLEVAVGEVVWVGETIGPGDPPEWHFVLIDFRADVIAGEARPGDDAGAVAWVPRAEIGSRPVTPKLLELLETLP